MGDILVEIKGKYSTPLECERCGGLGHTIQSDWYYGNYIRYSSNCPTCDGTGVVWINYSGLWCLGHNLDVVATIMTMAKLSWEQGFEAGRVIASICEPGPGVCQPVDKLSEGAGFVLLSEDSGN